jgi:hypothetical protein
MNKQEEMKGFKIHTAITIIVMILLIIINLLYVPEFLWFVYPLFGMSFGLAVHYYFGVHRNVSIK